MAQGAHKITEQFEQELCKYTGSPYAVAVDNCSNALFLALYYDVNIKGSLSAKFDGIPSFNKYHAVSIPKHTYPSVACEIIHINARIKFVDNREIFSANSVKGDLVDGYYHLDPTSVIDSSLHFTCNMYQPGYFMCLSFTGPYKHLKLGKGGAILTDDRKAYEWFKRARFSGRSECSYFEDNFDQSKFIDLLNEGGYFNVEPIAGWNFYMMPEVAAKGLALMPQFYNSDGTPKHNDDLCLPYPDLSKFKIFNQ